MRQQAKVKRPGEWLVAALRATGLAGDIRRVVEAQALLGEPLWRPPAPKGFSDDNAAWLDGWPNVLRLPTPLPSGSDRRLIRWPSRIRHSARSPRVRRVMRSRMPRAGRKQ